MPRQRPRLARQPWACPAGSTNADSFGRTGMCKLTEAGKAATVGGAAENEETRSDVLPDQLIYID